MGDYYLRYVEYDKAIDNYNKSLKIFEDLKDERGMAYVQLKGSAM